MEAELLDEVVLKDQQQDLEACVLGHHEPGLSWSRTGTDGDLLLSPQSKRRSILVRMMRPISVAFGEKDLVPAVTDL